MVYVTPKQEELTDVDRAIIGPARIITIPLENRRLVQQIGDMLAGLGRDMMMNATREGITIRECALILQNRIDELNHRIRHLAEEEGVRMPRRGRKKAEKREQGENEQETVTAIPFNRTTRFSR